MTTPSGKLAWGQAGSYDAVDDRLVITAVTRGRIGLVAPTVVEAGAGLTLILRGGWLGVATCGDRTSAVVGAREDLPVQALAGPPTGQPRQDVLWCDTNPDEGSWSVSVLTEGQTFGRFGLPLAYITVPVNANLASQFTIIPADAQLERRLLSYTTQSFDVGLGGWNYTSWGQANGINTASLMCVMEPGQWYRVRFDSHGCTSIEGSLQGRIGVGYRTAGQPSDASQLMRTRAIPWAVTNREAPASCEYVFRHDPSAQRVNRVFDGRLWLLFAGLYRPTSAAQTGPQCVLTVEDIGS